MVTRKSSLIIALLLIAHWAFFIVGCNTQGKPEASDILNKCISKMEALDSYKVTGSAIATTEEGDSKTTFKAEFDLTTRQMPRSHCVRISDDTVTNIYSYGGFLYICVDIEGTPGTWHKQESRGVADITLIQMIKMSMDPNSVRVLSESSTSYELGLDVRQQLANWLLYGAVDGHPETKSDPKKSATVLAVEQMKAIVVYTVAKDTMYLERVRIETNIIGIPEIGDLSSKEDYEFYDFNKPVEIALPKAAKAARE